MAFAAAFIFFYGQSAKGNALIKFHIVAYYRGLSDNGSRPVINKKRLADLRARVNVNAGSPVDMLVHHPGDKGNLPRP